MPAIVLRLSIFFGLATLLLGVHLVERYPAHRRGLSVLLGVAFVSGTFVLTDSLDRTFTGIFEQANEGTDVYVRGAQGAEGVMQDRAVESAITVFVDNKVARLRIDFVDDIDTLQGPIHIGIITPVAALAGQSRRLQLGRPFPH